MTGEHDANGHRMGRPWLIAGLCFAVTATAVLVLSDDARWLRLGIIAALWAALLGAFLATSYRRQADQTQESMDEAQAIYELELEREIAARREYELELEAEARRGLEASSRDELDALRNEVAALRDSLQQLFGAEVLYERVALTAQSTRMRSLREGQGALPSARPQESPHERPPRILSSPAAAAREDLADQRTELIARVLGAEPPQREPAKPNGELPNLSWFTQEPLDPAGPAKESGASRDTPSRDTPSRDTPSRNTASRNTASRNTASRDTAESGDLPSDLVAPYDFEWKPSWEEPSWEEPPARDAGHRRAAPPPEPAVNGHREFQEEPLARHNANSTLPEQAQEIQRQGRPGGRRRKAEVDEQDIAPLAEPGRHSRQAAEPEPPPEPTVPTGSHAHGRSVSDLLAAYGTEQPPRRRRRRD